MERAAAFKFAHEANVERYRRLLHTYLTDTERTFVEQRLAEEQLALQQLTRCAALTGASVDAA